MRFTLYDNSSGASYVDVPAARITAIEHNHYDEQARRWRAVLHLVGGERVAVTAYADTCALWLANEVGADRHLDMGMFEGQALWSQRI